MAGITHLNHICKQDMWHRFGVVGIADKLRKVQLRWFSHVFLAGGDKVCRNSFDLGVSDKRAQKATKAGYDRRRPQVSRNSSRSGALQGKMSAKDHRRGRRYQTGKH
ncbi:hypothetical protein ANCDUO_04912 [Ancylostoma duodenale]|uniref:Uncharacterized protein n=1 Tax=Ancylostoma duodenale TaxID=51022 RepID=A0A0C2D5C1_9BILA|nr:hypothetical protein ANCDUO_04912 [Ancylostoma duodenale]